MILREAAGYHGRGQLIVIAGRLSLDHAASRPKIWFDWAICFEFIGVPSQGPIPCSLKANTPVVCQSDSSCQLSQEPTISFQQSAFSRMLMRNRFAA